MPLERTTTTAPKLDTRTRARLKALSRVRQRPHNRFMKEAVQRYLDQEKTAELIKRETIERWQRYEDTAERICR